MTLAVIDLIAIAAWLVWNMAIAYGLSYLGGKLFGQDQKEAKDEPRGQSFAWHPRTTFQEGIPKAVSYGTNLHHGNMTARWTDVDEFGDEILRMILDGGGGPIQGVDVDEVLSDANVCLGGTPSFNILYNVGISNWYQTAANINDDDKSTYVGFYGGSGYISRGRYEAIVEFDSATIDRVEYRRWWKIKGLHTHTGYEKVYLWYGGAYHLIATKNFTRQGEGTDFMKVESGGPWAGVTKVKIEAEIYTQKKSPGESGDTKAGHRIYEIGAWRLRDVEGAPVLLNGQPIHNFRDAHVQGRLGTLNQTCMTGFEKLKLEYTPGAMIAHDEPIRWTSPNNFFDDIEYTLSFPRGLVYHDSSGGLDTHSVGVKVEISERDADSWTTLFDTTISGAQVEPLYKAYRVNELVPGSVVYGKQYDLRYTVTTETNPSHRIAEELVLRSVREVVDTAFTYPGRAILGITALATTSLSGSVDVSWLSDDKLVNVYADSAWSIEFTRNRAWIALDEVTQPVISGDGNGGGPFTIERYEGLDPSRVDLAFFYKWAQWCDDLVTSGVGAETEKRMPCDIICDIQTNVWSMFYEIAQIGRMYPSWHGVMLTGWIDKATDEDIDLITMDNTMARSWKSSYAGFGEMAGSVETFYKNSTQNYERKSRPVFNKNAGKYTRVIALEGVGVTSESFATRVGNHALKRNELVKNINSVQMPREALRYDLGRVVRIQCNVPGWGQSYRVITSPTNNTVELDRIIEDVAANDLIWVKTYNTILKKISLDSYTVQSVAGKVVTIVETWEAGCTPLKDHLAAIGIAGAIKLRRIIKMKHAQENYFDVELETYNTTLFTSDDTDPELTNPDYVPPASTAVTEIITRQEVVELITSMLPQPTNRDIPQRTNCEWTGDDVDTVTWSKLDASDPILFRWGSETYEITPDSTTLEFIYWDPDYPTEFKSTATPATAYSAGNWIMCTNRDGVPYPSIPIQLLHGGIVQVGTITAALGQIANLTVGTAQIINLAVETLKIKDEAVTVMVATFTAAEQYWSGHMIWREAQTLTITTTGAPVMIIAATQWRTTSADGGLDIRIQRDDSVDVFETNLYPIAQWGNPFCVAFVDEPDAGEHTYDLDFKIHPPDVGTGWIRVKNRSLVGKEVKK